MASNEEILRKGMIKAKEIIRQNIIESLKRIGDDAINHALDNRGYNNQLFNLHDSIGYAIYYDGSIIGEPKMSEPKSKEEDANGDRGGMVGARFLRQYTPEGADWHLVVVAGEFYSEWLEREKELNVLTESYQHTSEFSLSSFKKIPV